MGAYKSVSDEDKARILKAEQEEFSKNDGEDDEQYDLDYEEDPDHDNTEQQQQNNPQI